VIEFAPLREDHLPQVEQWLRREHVARWWRDPVAESLAEYRAAIEGRDPTDHYLIVLDGRPVGMIQTYLVSDHPEWEEIVQVGPGVAGLDLFVGEQELIGHELGPQVIDAFVREIVFARAGTHAVVAAVEVENRRSWRASRRPASAASATSRRTAFRTG